MKRNIGSKCGALSLSSSAQLGSSQFGPKLCGCGEILLLLKTTITENNERFFRRSRNWAGSVNCLWCLDFLLWFW